MRQVLDGPSRDFFANTNSRVAIVPNPLLTRHPASLFPSLAFTKMYILS